MNKVDTPSNFSQNQRRIMGIGITTDTSPASESVSPARSVISSRAGFQGTEITSIIMKVGNASPEVNRKEPVTYRSHSPIIGVGGEVRIEGEDEFNKVYKSVENLSRNSNGKPRSAEYSKLVATFGKPVISSTLQENNSLHFPMSTEKNASFNSNSHKDIRTASTRIIPDYVSAFSKPTDTNKRALEVNEASENNKTQHPNRRHREKTTNGRSKRAQQRQELTSQRNEGTKASAQCLIYPQYIQPVIKTQKELDTDAIYNSQRKHRDLRAQNQVSSASGDSSNEAPNRLQKLHTAFKESKSTPDTSDNDSETYSGRRRRQRPRTRNTANRSLHTPDYLRLTNRLQDTDSSSLLAQTQPKPNVSQPTDSRQISKQRRNTNRYRKQFYAETDNKYNTLPADFRPTESNCVATGDVEPKSFTSPPVHRNRFHRNHNQDDSSKHSELMINRKQTSVSLEDGKKERTTTQQCISNQSQDSRPKELWLQQANHGNQVTASYKENNTAVASGCNATKEKASAVPPQNKSKQISELKSLFDSQKVSKAEFGQVFNNKQQKPRRVPAVHLAVPTAEGEANETVHSQPMLKARKLSEDYWPRDEATQKLLNRGFNQLPTQKSHSECSGVLNEISDKDSTQDQVMNIVNRQKQADDTTPLSNSMGLAHSPKETNLSDPDCCNENIATNETKMHVNKNANSLTTRVRDSELLTRRSNARVDAGPCSVEASQTDPTKPPSPRWSFDDPDNKLKAFDHLIDKEQGTKMEKGTGTGIKNKNLFIHRSNFNESNCLNDDNRLSQFNGHEISAKDLSITSKFVSNETVISQKQHDNMTSPKLTEDLHGCSKRTEQSALTVEKNITLQTLPQSDISSISASNNPIAVSISTRKTSVVSQSTALPRNKTYIDEDPATEIGDIDEGCFTEDDGSTRPIDIDVPFQPLTCNHTDDNQVKEPNNICSTPIDRRRRKFSDTGQNSLDCNNKINGNETSTRSLSDPLQQNRKTSLSSSNAHDDNKINNNFMGPLIATGSNEQTELDLNNSASDLSGCSQNTSTQGDYDDHMQEFLREPNLIDEALAEFDSKQLPVTKIMKKKSFSDPNADAVLMAGGRTSRDADAVNLYNSSSEPALSEQLDQLGELTAFRNHCSGNTHRAWEKTVTSNSQGIGAFTQSIQEMSKSLLTDTVTSPRSNRKAVSAKARKRAELEHANSGSSKELTPSILDNPFEQEEEQFKKICEEMTNTEKTSSNSVGHSRSSSVPVVSDQIESVLVRKASDRGRRAGIVQAPSLNDVIVDDQSKLVANDQFFGGSVDRILPSTLPRAASTNGLDYQSYRSQNKQDLRRYVVMNLLETEGSYVKSLRILYENYLKPLKRPENHSICEPRLVDTIFFQIPEILQHHEKFYENVGDCFENWNSAEIKMGDIFMQSFNKDMLLESYTSYIKNYWNAREAVNVAIESKSAFKLFLEHCKRENKDKQGLSDLMIKPVQRIPRYELIIKDLLKFTPERHPDNSSLLTAQKEIHALSVQMNKGEKDAELADRHLRLLQEIEQIIESCVDLCGPSIRKFLHQDFCFELKSGNKKDRSLWLFSDLLMCTTFKKGKGSSLRRSSVNIYAMTSDRVMIDFSSKYKFLWKFALEDVELLKGSAGPNHQALKKQLQQLRSDQDALLQLEEITLKLNCNHAALDDNIKEMIIQTGQRITEKQQQLTIHGLTLPGRLEIGITTPDGMKLFQIEFPSEENKSQFEVLFWKAKKSFISLRGRLVPAFMKAIPISKTRNGMQFSCAASNIDTSPGTREVWVCNTDGYVGQICFLKLDPEPSQTTCNTVCNSKICCIAQVPTWDRRFVSTNKFISDVSTAPLGHSLADRHQSSGNSNRAHTIMPFDSDDSDEDNTSPFSTMSNCSMSPYSTNNSASNYASDSTCVNELKDASQYDWGIDSDEEINLPIISPLLPSPYLHRKFEFSDKQRSNSVMLNVAEDVSGSIGENGSMVDSGLHHRVPQNSFMHALLGGGAWKKDSDGSTLHGSLEDLLTDQGEKINEKNSAEERAGGRNSAASKLLANNGSMWLGTEDGKIKVYSTTEAIRVSKHCAQLNHSASVQCILHHQGQVFVALGNGDLVIYFRNMTNGHWDFDNKKTIELGTSPHPITKMVVVGDKELWCGCQNQVMILDITQNAKSHSQTHTVKSFFSVSQDNKRQIYCMACCGCGVWIALDRRAQIKLYHTKTHDLLTDIDVSQPVSKMLASSDAIIRQHKAACLRITALLVCKDLLWVGTSAGVVLTMALPSITEGTNSLSLPIIPQGLAYGHTGHVRFLTSVDVVDKDVAPSRGGRRPSSAKRRLSSASASSQLRTLIISGGDGYEDFRMNAASEAAGREDSTNHLLIWRV